MKKYLFALITLLMAVTIAAPPAQAASTVTIWSTSSAGWTDTTTWEWSPYVGPAYSDFYIHMWYSGTNCPTSAFQKTQLRQDGVKAEIDQYGEVGDWTVHVDSTGKVVGFGTYMFLNQTFRISWQGNRPACNYHIRVWEYA